jgi:glycolate oxidase
VEPGVITGEFQALVEKEGLFYPPDPSSQDQCTLGGNAAANAGGPRAFKYGVTRDYVLGAEACLVGGRSLRVGRRTRKGVAGYDVTSLLVGSEGTLAVFTELVLRLVPKPPDVGTMLALYKDVEAAAEAVSRVVAAGLVPRCLELLDEATLGAVRAAGVSVDARAGAMLLVEVDGDTEALGPQMERLGEACGQGEGSIDVLVAQDAARRAQLWAARRSMSLATRRLAKHKLSEDVVVPRTQIAELLSRTREACEREKVRHLAYGHAGDGNLHVNFLWDDDAEAPRVSRAIEALMRITVSLGGTISGEHGIGLAKLPYLPLEQSEDLLQLQRDLKRVFDPRGLLNPGKIFAPGGHRGC